MITGFNTDVSYGGEVFHVQLLAIELDGGADAALGSERIDLAQRELALGEDFQHGRANGTRSSNHCDIELATHMKKLSLL